MGQLLGFWGSVAAYITAMTHYNNASGCDWFLTYPVLGASLPVSVQRSTQCFSFSSSLVPDGGILVPFPSRLLARCMCQDCHYPAPALPACVASPSNQTCFESDSAAQTIRFGLIREEIAPPASIILVPRPNCTAGLMTRVCIPDGVCNVAAGENMRNCPDDCYCGKPAGSGVLTVLWLISMFRHFHCTCQL